MGKSVANPSTGTAKNASNYISVYISVSDRCSENRMPDRVFEMRCGSSCLCFLSGLWGFFLGKPSDEHFARYIVPLRFHIAGGMGALLAGPWQFSEGLRNRALEFHRWIGRFYLLSVTLGSIAGFVMGDGFNGGPSHPSRIWHTGRSLVCHCSAGLPERA
jgi:hypothetical protein